MTEQTWISMKDQPLPSDGDTYLVTNGENVVPYISGVIHNKIGTAHDWHYGDAITHWMPMPAPPIPTTNDAPAPL